MSMEIMGDVDKHRVFCSGSFTKLVTTYVCLSLLAEKYDLNVILDDMNFLDEICKDKAAKNILIIFQNIIRNRFSIRDLCSYYAGVGYTFDVAQEELDKVEEGFPFKHHSIMDEKTFLYMCSTHITRVHKDKCKFHYSELSIIFLGYVIEKIYNVKMEDLYKKYVIKKFGLRQSQFSRVMIEGVYVEDLSDRYDYPSIAILDHGYFCYSNAFFTSLSDMKILLEKLLEDPIFTCMTDMDNARAASNRIMEGMAVEIREVGDDILYGYEGLSYSGTNIWAYSTKQKKGYLTYTNDEDKAYDIYHLFGYENFDLVPYHTEKYYFDFIHQPHLPYSDKAIPPEYQGEYQRVRINEKELPNIFVVGDHFIVIRNPTEIKYDVIFVNNNFRVRGKDGEPDSKVGFIESKNKNRYMYYDGTLYKKI